MNIISLFIGFIIGAVCTFVFLAYLDYKNRQKFYKGE